MPLKMTTIQPDGDTRDWEIDVDKLTFDDHWPELQREIETDGGKPVRLLEFVRVNNAGTEMCLIVDENGIFMDRKPNPKATLLYRGVRENSLHSDDGPTIHGAAILVHGRKFDIMD